MPPVEKEMIALLFNGASTRVENLRISFFLIAWPSFLLAVLRMARNEEEKKSFTPTKGFKNQTPSP